MTVGQSIVDNKLSEDKKIEIVKNGRTIFSGNVSALRKSKGFLDLVWHETIDINGNVTVYTIK